MKPNIGVIDCFCRIALSMILIGTGLTYDSWWGILGLFPMFGYLFRWSPLYYLFRINTIEMEKKLIKQKPADIHYKFDKP